MDDCRTRELLAAARQNDKEAFQELAEKMAPLVKALAARMGGPAEQDDLFQVGMIGLLKAVKKFDLRAPVKFISYAVPWISGEIKMYRRQHGSMLKISRSLWEQSRQVEKRRQELAHILGRQPTINELAHSLHMTPEDITFATEAFQPLLPLEKEEACFDAESSEEAELVDRLSLYDGLSRLAPLEKRLITLRFFEERTQEETAVLLFLSQRQVSRLEKRILDRLRHYLA